MYVLKTYSYLVPFCISNALQIQLFFSYAGRVIWEYSCPSRHKARWVNNYNAQIICYLPPKEEITECQRNTCSFFFLKDSSSLCLLGFHTRPLVAAFTILKKQSYTLSQSLKRSMTMSGVCLTWLFGLLCSKQLKSLQSSKENLSLLTLTDKDSQDLGRTVKYLVSVKLFQNPQFERGKTFWMCLYEFVCIFACSRWFLCVLSLA